MKKQYKTIASLEKIKADTEGMPHNLAILAWRVVESPNWYYINLEVDGGEVIAEYKTDDWNVIKDFCSSHDNHGKAIYGLGHTNNELYNATIEYIKGERQ